MPCMNVFIDTLGCRLNEAETQQWSRGFVAAGHRVVRAARDADLMVLNTCAVTGEAERKSRQHARRLHRENPVASIVLSGCFAELDHSRAATRVPVGSGAAPVPAPGSVAATLPGVDLVVRNGDKDRLVELVLDNLGSIATGMPRAATEPGDPHVYRAARTRAFVKVQDGCRHRCTFCIVTVARGDERSRPTGEITEEIEALGREGHREVVLTGVHLGGYGTDLGTSLEALVRAVLRDTSIPRVRLSSLEPWDLSPDFFELFADPRLMPHLHLPLQSGCDAVLRRMGRRASVASFTSLVGEARRRIDGLTLTTDLIVGFPGETDAEFEESLSTLEAIGFGHVHLFSYSPREGTRAARRPDQVPPSRTRERMHEARAVTERMAIAHRRAFLGTTREVLYEEIVSGDDRVDVARHGCWRGHTDNYLRVTVRGTRGESLRHGIAPVTLTDLVDGELVGARVQLAARAE